MDFSDILDSIITFFTGNPIIAVVTVLVLIFFIWRNPKFSLFILLLILILAGALYFILNVASTGSSKKEKLIHEQNRQLEDLR